MARQREDLVYRPDLQARKEYDELYALYRTLADARRRRRVTSTCMRTDFELTPRRRA